MVNRDVVNFISSNLKRGMTYDEIQSQLLARGYSDFEINQARDALMTGQKLDSPVEVAEDRLGVKWFFYTIGIVAFVVFMFIIFGIIFSNVNPTTYSVTEEAVYGGFSFNLTKNAVVEIETFRGKSMELTMIATENEISFSGDLGVFSIERGSNKLFDVDSDGIDDLKIMYFYDGTQRMVSLNGVCQENWGCSEWSECVSGKKFRTCNDNNSCGSELHKPLIEEACSVVLGENYSVSEETEVFENETEEVVEAENNDSSSEPEPSEPEDVVVTTGNIVSSDIGIYVPKSIYAMEENFLGNYSVEVVLNNTNVNFLLCYVRDGYDKYCEDHISSGVSNFDVLDDLAPFSINENGFVKRDLSFNETGTYRYEFYVYLCSYVNDILDVDDCMIPPYAVDSEDLLYGKSYDFEHKILNIV